MKDIGILGSSGFAREVGDVACELGYRPVYVARDQAELARWDFPADIVLESDIGRYTGMDFAIGIGENLARQKVAARYAGLLRFPSLIHPSATFGQGQRAAVAARCGVVVCAGARFMSCIQVGDFTVFNMNSTIGHDSIIEDFANICPGVNISGNVHIGARCWIGTGAAINQGTRDAKLHIGADTVIGSGTVVLRNCQPGAVYAGVPAKRIK